MLTLWPYGKIGDTIYTLATAKALKAVTGEKVAIRLAPSGNERWRTSYETCQALVPIIQELAADYVADVTPHKDRAVGESDIDLKEWFTNGRDAASKNLLWSVFSFVAMRANCQDLMKWKIVPWLAFKPGPHRMGKAVSWTGRYIWEGCNRLQRPELVRKDREWWEQKLADFNGEAFIGTPAEYYSFMAYLGGKPNLEEPKLITLQTFFLNVVSAQHLYCGQSAALAIRHAVKRPVTVNTSQVCPDVIIKHDEAEYRPVEDKGKVCLRFDHPVSDLFQAT